MAVNPELVALLQCLSCNAPLAHAPAAGDDDEVLFCRNCALSYPVDAESGVPVMLRDRAQPLGDGELARLSART